MSEIKKPEKKDEIKGDYSCNRCAVQGYNQSCDDHEPYIKSLTEENKRLQRARNIEQGAWEETKKYQDENVILKKEIANLRKQVGKPENVRPDVTVKKKCNCDREERQCRNCGGWH